MMNIHKELPLSFPGCPPSPDPSPPFTQISRHYLRRVGLKAGPFARWMLRGHKRKHWMRTLYSLRSLFRLRRSSMVSTGTADYWQAGRSVAGIHTIEPVAQVLAKFSEATEQIAPPQGTP